ncbi:unnamed protein product [Alternaria alternata]
MTGYSANVAAFVNTTGGEYVPFGSFKFAYYIIHDGRRIGLTDNYVITGSTGPYLQDQPLISSNGYDFKPCHYISYDVFNTTACKLQRNISRYAAEYGFNGEKTQSSVFGEQFLQSPILNISAPSLEKIPDGSNLEHYHPSNVKDLEFRVTDNSSLLLWTYDDNIYHLHDMQKNGRCQATLNYHWGFSYIQLFIMVILNIVWTLGLYIMWLRASMMTKQRGRKKEDVAGEQKAVLELAAAMREQVKGPTNEEGDDVSTLMEAKLHRLITKDLRGGSISYKTPLLLSGESGDEWNTKAWIKSHKLPTLATKHLRPRAYTVVVHEDALFPVWSLPGRSSSFFSIANKSATIDKASRALVQPLPPSLSDSYRARADRSGVPHTTLHHRARGRRSIEEKAQSQQYLAPYEEDALVRFLLQLSDLGQPVRIKYIRFLAFYVTSQRSETDRPLKPPSKN